MFSKRISAQNHTNMGAGWKNLDPDEIARVRPIANDR